MTAKDNVSQGATVIQQMAAQGEAFLAQERFKDAIELYKRLLIRDTQPNWQSRLLDAYAGYARALADKGMVKEAATVLENTRDGSGRMREPLLYATCLARQGRIDHALQVCLAGADDGGLPEDEAAGLQELAAALWLARPGKAPAEGGLPAWLEAADRALAAWSAGAPAEEVDRLLQALPLRSPVRSLRLILKASLTAPADAGKAAGLLAMVPADSLFAGLAATVAAAQLADRDERLRRWAGLTPRERALYGDLAGIPAPRSVVLKALLDAEQRGPKALLELLIKEAKRFPAEEHRAACLALLPLVPDQMRAVEKLHGHLPDLERHRVLALAAQAAGDWEVAHGYWQHVVTALGHQTGPDRNLEQAVVLRHLAGFGSGDVRHKGHSDEMDEESIEFLERAVELDPEHLPAVLHLIAVHRSQHRPERWHHWVDWALERFSGEAGVLAAAIDATVARKAYKKAAGLAKRLLGLDPINFRLQERMFDLQLAHARRQVQGHRLDLARKDLEAAAAWDRADAPSGILAIGRGLVALRQGQTDAGEAMLRQGVDRIGGLVGRFRAVLEAELMKAESACPRWLRKELAEARTAPPTKTQVLAVAAILSREELGHAVKTAPKALGLILPWLRQGAALPFTLAEIHAIAEGFRRVRAWDLLDLYAKAAHRREPEEPAYRFYQMLVVLGGRRRTFTPDEEGELSELELAARQRRDFQTASEIDRLFKENPQTSPFLTSDVDLDTVPVLQMEDDEVLEVLEGMQSLLRNPPPELLALLDGLTPDETVDSMLEKLRASALGKLLPEQLLRDLCRTMVENPPEGAGKRRRKRSRKGSAQTEFDS